MDTPSIEPLADHHSCKQFDCGNDWLNRYLRQHALPNQEAGYGRTFVAVSGQGSTLPIGFFTLSMGSVQFANLPPELARKMPKYPMPVTHMGCLAVASAHQGKGLGSFLLIEALRLMLRASEIVAARAIEVKAIDDKARIWYEGFGFTRFLDHPMHLYLPIASAKKIIAAAGGWLF